MFGTIQGCCGLLVATSVGTGIVLPISEQRLDVVAGRNMDAVRR